jgi:hypothetical protein
MSNAKAVPIACLDAIIIKHSLVPVSSACNWGQGLVLESILPFMGLDSAALNGILWDLAAMNSEGSEIPTGPRK